VSRPRISPRLLLAVLPALLLVVSLAVGTCYRLSRQPAAPRPATGLQPVLGLAAPPSAEATVVAPLRLTPRIQASNGPHALPRPSGTAGAPATTASAHTQASAHALVVTPVDRTVSVTPKLPPGVETAIPDEALPSSPADALAAAEPMLLEMQLGRLARRVLRTYRTGQDVMIPLAAWLDFAEVSHDAAGTRVTGRLQPSSVTFAVDAASRTAQLGARPLAVARGDLEMIGGEVYASLRLLADLFGVTAGIDRESAAVLFHNPEGLPIARRMEREAARSVQVGGGGKVAADQVHRGSQEDRPGLVAAYEVRTSSLRQAPTSYDVGVASGVAGGSAVLRTQGSTVASPRVDASWSRAWPSQRWLTQLRLGDGLMSGPRPETSRGFSIGNGPINRPILVEDLPFAGALPPDWSIEAYRGGHLVGFDSVGTSGRYSLTLPVQYGENPVDFVAYGPFGEVRTFNRTFRALPSMVPAGLWEYGLSAGACRTSRCDAAANLDLRHGLSRRWTARAGLDQLWGGARATLSHPYAGIVGTPTNALGVELEGVANLLYRAGLRFEPSIRLRLTADYVSYADSSGSPFLLPGTREQWSFYGRLTPGRRPGAAVLEAQGTRTVTATGISDQARTGLALQLHDMMLRPYVRAERTTSVGGPGARGYAGIDATVLPPRSLGTVLGGFWLQGQAEVQAGHSFSSAAVLVARNLGRGFRLEAGTRWEHALPGPIYTLSLVSQLDVVRSTSLVTAPAGAGEARVDQTVGGSVVWSRGGGAPLFSSEPSLDRAGVGGRVFLDLNGDGRRQLDEPPAPGTRLLVANRWVTADEDGRYQLWNVPPWEELLISVDTTSLASPWWAPQYGAMAVMPTPNLIRSADVPVVIGGIVEGNVVLEGSTSRSITRPIPILLVEQEHGARTVIESFSDGSFYRMGLPPGHYEARVDEMMLRSLGLTGKPVRFELRRGRSASDPGSTVSDLHLVLRSR
jgi:hypothetical protein